MGLVRQIAALLFIVALPIALVITDIRIVANEPRVYQYATDHFDTPATTGIPRSELLRASGELRDYFNNGESTIFVRVRTDQGGQVSLFNSRETAHLRDVKSLLRAAFRVQEISVMFVLAYVVTVFVWAREGSARVLAREVLAAGVLGLVILLALSAFALVGFDSFWARFHTIAFPSGNWEFDPATDHLIQMFPDNFWRDVTLWIGAGALAELGGLAAASGVYLGLTRKRAESVAVPGGVGAEA